MRRVFARLGLFFVCLSFVLTFSSAQQNETSRIVERINESQLVRLKGNTHPLALSRFDVGVASPDMPLQRMLLVLRRSPEQQFALRGLLDDLHDTGSPVFHKWLTPDEFGRRFGPSNADLETVNAWLLAQGFQISKVSRGRTMIEFSGTAGQVERAFRTSIHKFAVDGQVHYANATDPQIPAALSPVVEGIFTLYNFHKQPMLRMGGRAPVKFTPGQAPQVTFTNPTEHALGPGDFSRIYNISPVYGVGIDGTGVTIGVVGRTEIDLSDVQEFRNIFGLGGIPPQIVENGPSPGNLGDNPNLGGEEFEAVLDTTWSNAIAPGANVKLVVSASTDTTDGVDLSELYIIDNNAADIMSESFGVCEAVFTSAQAAGFSLLAEQAAAQGITYLVSTGDTGAPGCDNLGEVTATGPISVNILASTPFNVAVGGTMFNENGQDSKYWSNSPPLDTTALSYIPENVWNESCAAAKCGSTNANIAATGGGTSAVFLKPSWQAGVSGIPTANFRHLPDISLTAALHDPYLLCVRFSCQDGFIFFIGGTSASTPSFAGIMALVNQKMGGRQGQANYVLYKLASGQTYSQCNGSKTTALPSSACIFSDITVGNNAVPGESGYGTSTAKFQSGVAFDLATGLGSVNVNNLVNQWGTASFRASKTSLSLSPTSFAHGAAVNVNISVAPGSGSGVPSGDVSLRSDVTPSGLDGAFFTLSGGSINSSTNLLAGGSYNVIAHYAGDATFASSDSLPIPVTITPESSVTALSILGFDTVGNLIPYSTGTYGDPAYLRADVSGSSGHGFPSGQVTFKEGAVNLFGSTTFALNASGNTATAQGAFTIPVGPHTITASYGGDASFNASTSSTVSITVVKAPTTVSATASRTNVRSTDLVSLAAVVGTTSAGRGPTGNATFLVNGSPITGGVNPVSVFPQDGSGSLQNGTFSAAGASAGLSTTLPPGQDNVTVQYAGDTNYAGATSNSVVINVDAGFDLSLASNSLTVTQGSSGSVKVSIVGQSAYTGTVNFTSNSCSGLPRESTCSFNPTSVVGTGDTMLTIQTTAPHSASLNPIPFVGGLGFAFGMFFVAGGRQKARCRSAFFAFLFCVALVGLGACGGGGSTPPPDPGTPKGSYSVTVTATSGTLPQQRQVVTLVVQ